MTNYFILDSRHIPPSLPPHLPFLMLFLFSARKIDSTTTNALQRPLREGFIQKKKLWIFTTGGGVIPKCWHFHNFFLFFFACSNSSISAIKIFFEGGKGTPWPIYFENLDNFQLNIDFFLSILGFQGRIFLNLHKMFFGSRS